MQTITEVPDTDTCTACKSELVKLVVVQISSNEREGQCLDCGRHQFEAGVAFAVRNSVACNYAVTVTYGYHIPFYSDCCRVDERATE